MNIFEYFIDKHNNNNYFTGVKADKNGKISNILELQFQLNMHPPKNLQKNRIESKEYLPGPGGRISELQLERTACDQSADQSHGAALSCLSELGCCYNPAHRGKEVAQEDISVLDARSVYYVVHLEIMG